MKFKLKPWAHQLEAITKAENRKNYGLLFEVGSGKTGTCINILRSVFNKNKEVMPTLIICPPIVINNWEREFVMHSNVNPKLVQPLIGPGAKRLETFKKSKAKIFITNYEVFSVKSMEPLYDAFMAWYPSCLVLDESHKCKDIKSKRTKKVIALSDRAVYKYILTGTPILNSLMDIFTQFRILDGGKRFGKNFFSFRARYFYDKSAGMPKSKYFPNWVPRKEAVGEIKSLMSECSMHVTKDECLDLPPLVKKTIHVPMSKAQAKLYEEMKNDFITFINDKASVANLAITKALRLQQIVSGFIAVEDGAGERSNVRLKDNNRAAALKELLEEITPGHKVIVWAVFKENYATIKEVCEKLKLGYVEVHGGISQKQKMEAVDSFNTDKKTRVLIGHPGSGGIGINLIAASYSIFYSRSFSLEYDIQAEARNYRGGSEIHAKVTRIDLVTPGTIDELVAKSLASKEELSYQVLRKSVGEI